METLVIDDSRAMRVILRTVLQDLGHTVTEAANGREAIELVQSARRFGLALVDWNMPEMDGYDFVRKVRSDPANCAMKLMMVTSEVEMANITKALEAGADEYVMKPFTLEALREKLALLIG